jgi:LacI family transcriptional regulator
VVTISLRGSLFRPIPRDRGGGGSSLGEASVGKKQKIRKSRKSVRRASSAVTLDEVAALAKVSPMTVSRVVNGTGSVRATTRERVLQAVQKLGYSPNVAASALAAAKTTRIALVYNNPSGAYLRELLIGLLRATSLSSTQLLIEDWDELDPHAERKAALRLAGNVAGVILPPPLCESRSALRELVNAKMPVVAIAPGRPLQEVSCVRIDDYRASKEIVAYLIGKGHRRIGFIQGSDRLSASARRLQGYQAALHDAGLAPDSALVQPGDYTYRSGLQAAETLLTLPVPPTAIFASNDDMAAAVVSVAHRYGREVPRDLSVVGYDNTTAATMVWPELTTIGQPIAAMADLAVEILLRNQREKQNAVPALVDHVVEHRLIERASVAAPAPAGATRR